MGGSALGIAGRPHGLTPHHREEATGREKHAEALAGHVLRAGESPG